MNRKMMLAMMGLFMPIAMASAVQGSSLALRLTADADKDEVVAIARKNPELKSIVVNGTIVAEWVPIDEQVDLKMLPVVLRENEILLLRSPDDVNDSVEKFTPDRDDRNRPVWRVSLSKKESDKLYSLTKKENIGRMIAIIANGRVVAVSKILNPLYGGSIVIPPFVEGMRPVITGSNSIEQTYYIRVGVRDLVYGLLICAVAIIAYAIGRKRSSRKQNGDQ